jgi:hypothetical protein
MRSTLVVFRRLLSCPCSLLLVLLFAMAARGQNFAQPSLIPTGNWPTAVYTADVNNDGLPDLLYIDHGASPTASTTHILLGDGKGGFKESARIATAGTSIAFGDLTGQGHVDIGWFTQIPNGGGNFLIIAAGKGDGTFASAVNYGGVTGAGFTYLTAGRLHDTGGLDIVAQDSSANKVYAFRVSTLTSKLEAVSFASLPDGTGPATILDLNNDGHGDLIVNGQIGLSAQIFLGTGQGLSASGVPNTRFRGLSGQQDIHSLLLHDYDGDGRPDLITEGTNGHIDVYTGQGDGTFPGYLNPAVNVDGRTGFGGHLVAATDLGHAGHTGVLAASPAGISSLIGQSSLQLSLKGIYNAGPGRTSYAVADFNGDGNLDLAVDSPEGIAILYGNADGSFQTSRAFATGEPALSGALGALTASGKLDVVVSTAATQAQALLGNGDGTFGAATPTTSQTGPAGLWSIVQLGDFNQDGKLDLVLTADGGNANLPATGSGLSIQLGDGAGGFGPLTTVNVSPQFSFPSSSSCSPPFDHYPGLLFGTSAIGDFNGDGIPDIANRGADGYRILRGNNGTATSSSTMDPTLYFSDVDGKGTLVDCDLHAHDLVISGELNNDGKTDGVYQGAGASTGSLLVYLSDAAGKFAVAGDLSQPGQLTSPGQLVAPALSNTFGGLSTTLGFPAFPGSGVIADLDGDGSNDLIVAYDDMSADHTAPTAANPNYIYIWFGSGGGKFLTSAKHPVNPVRITPSRNFYQVSVADVNGDGIPDLILSDGYVLSYQIGNGDGTFGAENHLLAGQGINTISAGDLRKKGTQDLVIANGGVTFSNRVMNKDVLAVNPDVQTGGVTVLLNTAKLLVTMGTLAASPEPSVYFSPYTITATLSGSPSPTGSVSFSVDGVQLGSANVVNGVATIVGSTTLLPGTHALTASYSGDSSYAANTTLTGTHTVLRAPTSVTLTPTTPLTVFYGEGIDGTFAVTVVDPTFPANGNYSVLDNGVLVPGCASLPTTARCPYGNPQLLDAGVHALSITYLGDPVNAPGTSAPVAFTIIPDTTTMALASSKNPANQGDAVTFTATLTGNIAVPTGSVTFLDGTTVLGTGTLTNGVATLTTSSLAVGTHPVTASYAGNIDFNGANSTVINEVILAVPVTLGSVTTLSSSMNPSVSGQSVTFTAHVSVMGSTTAVATGNVTFLDGTATIGSGTLSNGIATFSTTTLAVGSHAITAAYAGFNSTTVAPSISASVSSVLTQVVTVPVVAGNPSFILTVTPHPLILGVGRTGVLQVGITAVGGFNQTVQLSCAGLPPESACMFLNKTITGGGTTTLDLTTAAPRDCGTNQPYFLGQNGSFGLPAGGVLAAGLGLLFMRRRRIRGLLLVAVAGLGLAGLSGCGHCTDLGTRPGNYSFTVTATPMSGPVTAAQSVTVQLTMTIP